MRKWAKGFLISSILVATPSNAQAQESNPNAWTFFQTLVELRGLGMRALLDPRGQVSGQQLAAAGQEVRERNLRARAKGSPLFCWPSNPPNIDNAFVFSRLQAIGESRLRRMTLTDAWQQIFVREFPCK